MYNKNVNGKLARIRSRDKKKSKLDGYFCTNLSLLYNKNDYMSFVILIQRKKTIDKIILLMKGSLFELFVSTKILCND